METWSVFRLHLLPKQTLLSEVVSYAFIIVIYYGKSIICFGNSATFYWYYVFAEVIDVVLNAGEGIIKLGIITLHHFLAPFHVLCPLVIRRSIGPLVGWWVRGGMIGVLLTRGTVVQTRDRQVQGRLTLVLGVMTAFFMTRGTLGLTGCHHMQGGMFGVYRGLRLRLGLGLATSLVLVRVLTGTFLKLMSSMNVNFLIYLLFPLRFVYFEVK